MNGNSTVIASEKIKTHIDLIGREFEGTSGARAYASMLGIERGIVDPDSLFDHCQRLIGYTRNIEGYLDGYTGNPDWDAEQPEEEPLIGYGVPFTSYQAYLDLSEHYAADWLRTVLLAYLLERPNITSTEALNKVDSWLTSAKSVVLVEGARMHRQRIESACWEYEQARKKALEDLDLCLSLA